MDDPLLSVARELRSSTPRQEPDDDPLLSVARDIGRQQPEQPRRMGKATAGLTAAVSGLPGMEAIGGLISSLTGGTYQGGRRSIAQAQQQARESIGTIPYEVVRAAPEIATMAVAPVTAAPRVLGTMLGRAGLAGGIEAVRGAARAGMQDEEAPSLAETAEAAAKGGAFGAIGSVVGEGVVRGGLGAARGIRGLIGESAPAVPGSGIIPRAQQVAADLARRGGLNRAAEIVEPIGPQRAARVLREELPTPQSATEFRTAAQRAIEQARQAVGEQAGQVRQTARESVADITARGRQRLTGVRGDVRVARAEAQRVMDEGVARARQSVAEATERLRAAVPQEVPTNADELREAIRATQRAAGDVSYQRAFQLADGVDFSPVARQVEDVVRRNPEVAAAYRDAFTRGGAQEAGEDVLPALDLPTFDRMRQNINERAQAFLRGDPTGVPRARAREAFADIATLENAYVDRLRQVRGDEAANALQSARAEYAEYFRQLDALADGRNLGRFGFGKREGRIEPNRLTITNLERELENVSPEARQAFQVGAREFVNDVLRRTPEDARRVASNLVGTEERFRRTALALGEDTANDLRVVYRDAQQVRESARRGLQTAREQARGGVAKARTAAEVQADIIRAETTDARRQVLRDRDTFLKRIVQQSPDVAAARQARDVSRQMSLARAAVNDADAALGFVNSVVPNMTPEARIAAGRVMATRIDDEVMGLMAQPGGAQKVAERFAQWRQNPATNAILGRALEEAERRMQAGVPLRRPVGAVFGANIGGSLAANR